MQMAKDLQKEMRKDAANGYLLGGIAIDTAKHVAIIEALGMYQQTYMHWKDIYQRIFISHILSKNREKGYSTILFLSGIC
jgi:hypothetical protein